VGLELRIEALAPTSMGWSVDLPQKNFNNFWGLEMHIFCILRPFW